MLNSALLTTAMKGVRISLQLSYYHSVLSTSLKTVQEYRNLRTGKNIIQQELSVPTEIRYDTNISGKIHLQMFSALKTTRTTKTKKKH